MPAVTLTPDTPALSLGIISRMWVDDMDDGRQREIIRPFEGAQLTDASWQTVNLASVTSPF